MTNNKHWDLRFPKELAGSTGAAWRGSGEAHPSPPPGGRAGPRPGHLVGTHQGPALTERWLHVASLSKVLNFLWRHFVPHSPRPVPCIARDSLIVFCSSGYGHPWGSWSWLKSRAQGTELLSPLTDRWWIAPLSPQGTPFLAQTSNTSELMIRHTSLAKLRNIPYTQRNIFPAKKHKEKIKRTPMESLSRLETNCHQYHMSRPQFVPPSLHPHLVPLGEATILNCVFICFFLSFTVLPYRYMLLNKILFNVTCSELYMNGIICVCPANCSFAQCVVSFIHGNGYSWVFPVFIAV